MQYFPEMRMEAISMSHARVLSKMDDEEKVNELAKKIVTEDMSFVLLCDRKMDAPAS